MPVLTGIDVVGIQRFVFGSNRLRDVVGASALVDWATASDGALSGLPCSRVLLAAGGNAIIRFDGDAADTASREFVKKLTRRLFDQTPGVEVAIAHRPFDDGEFAAALNALQVDLACEKSERRPDASMLGLSVTATCANTGLPAVGFDPRDRVAPLSRQALAMSSRSVRDAARCRWKKFIPPDVPDPSLFEFPDELDELGASSGERSLLGVVHVDGNGIGNRIKAWIEKCVAEKRSDATVLQEYVEWSGDLIKVGEAALQAVVSRVFSLISVESTDSGTVRWLGRGQENAWGRASRLAFKLKRKTAKQRDDDESGALPWWLPIRPVLLGGDDLTFLCDGRIALDLAAVAIRAMEQQSVRHLGGITACAGVAIVPHHSPFVRAYELSESLCQSAKRTARAHRQPASFIDWNIGLPKPSASLSEVREREYLAPGAAPAKSLKLTCRPYRLGASAADVGTWTWLDQALLDDQQLGLRGPLWSEHRNKAKELREILAGGPGRIEHTLKRWQIVTPKLEFVTGDKFTNGYFASGETPLLDALELLDLHLPLEIRSK